VRQRNRQAGETKVTSGTVFTTEAKRAGCFGRSLGSGRLGLAVALTDVLPRHSQRVQDEVIVEAEFGWIQDGLPSVHHMGILRDAPGLVVDNASTMRAGGVGGITIAVEPGT
jgi:hypothetical protein